MTPYADISYPYSAAAATTATITAWPNPYSLTGAIFRRHRARVASEQLEELASLLDQLLLCAVGLHWLAVIEDSHG